MELYVSHMQRSLKLLTSGKHHVGGPTLTYILYDLFIHV